MMRLLITLIILAASTASAAPLTLGILDYVSLNQSTRDWVDARFAVKVNHYNPPSSGQRFEYYDIYGPQTIAETNLLTSWLDSKGVARETVFIHGKKNWTISGQQDGKSWLQMDKFDKFEDANGVLLEQSGTYTDKTTVAYSGATPYTTVDRNLFVGYEEPFDRLTFNVRTAGVDLSGSWQYWNGSNWSALSVVDGTAAMTIGGTISFTPPANWARTVINGSRSKYFLRFSFASVTTAPVINTIKGDDWLNGGAATVRGWDATSGTIINPGTPLAYNPTPPPGALARFPYQARIPYWASNRFVANPALKATIDGIANSRAWAQFLVYRTGQLTGSYSGIMGDDGGASGNLSGLNINTAGDTDFEDSTANSWATENLAKYQDLVAGYHAANPGKLMGLNASTKTLVAAGDFNLIEGYFATVNSGGATPKFLSADSTGSCYDDYLNSSRFGLFVYSDPGAVIPFGVTWDTANRGPLVALAKHLIGLNSGTYFAYHNGVIYNTVDEVTLTNGTVWHQATQGTPALSSVKSWASYFPAMSVDFGIPDTAGLSGGARVKNWKTAAEIGGVQGVYRRDYTNAIVLFRPSAYNSIASEYNSYSSSMELGATYYPLNADATIGTAITSIQLRTGEGAILLKSASLPISSPVNGACGAAHGGTFSSPPTNLCTTGIQSAISGTYAWTCAGSNGGTTASCSASYVASATCSDGIKNQDETGIDCGGVCTACLVPVGEPTSSGTIKASGRFHAR